MGRKPPAIVSSSASVWNLDLSSVVLFLLGADHDGRGKLPGTYFVATERSGLAGRTSWNCMPRSRGEVPSFIPL